MDIRNTSSILRSKRSPGEGNGNPLQYSCLENLMDRGAWWATESMGSQRVKSLHSCPTLCDPMDYNPPGSSLHGILQARILEWVAMPFFRGSSQPRDGTHTSYVFCSVHQGPMGSPSLHLELQIHWSYKTVSLISQVSNHHYTASNARNHHLVQCAVLSCSIVSNSLWPHGL